MDEIGSRSWWLSLDPYTPNAPLRESTDADLAVVGGGFTGLWTALLWARRHPDGRVVVLEATAVGYGASGRNGGFAMTLVHRTLSHLAALLGDQAARDVHVAARRAVEAVAETVAAESIACDLEAPGLLTVSDAPDRDRVIERELETAARLGVDDHFEFLDRARAQECLHSERVRCAFRERPCLLLNPARLVRGLKVAAERAGVQVFENTPVTGWEEREGTVVLRTREGSVRADRVVWALNAWSARFSAGRSLLPFYSYICLTRPLSPQEWESVGWRGREGVEDRRVGLHYFRPTADGRILWGGRDPAFHPDGPDPRYDRDEHIFARLRGSFEWYFPQLRHVPFEWRWGGPIAVTGDFLPAIGWLDRQARRMAFAHGYNGHGVAITHLAARALVDLLDGVESEWTGLPFVGRAAPPLGPRWVRDPLVRWTLRRQLRADDEGRDARDPLPLRVLNRLSGANLRLG